MKPVEVSIGSVIIDKTLYPREAVDWHLRLSYKGAMKAGAKFPPIVLARVEGVNNVCIDGLHRLLSSRDLKRATISATHLGILTRTQAFAEAARLNAMNGKPLSFTEKLAAWKRLVDEGVPMKKAAETIVFMPPSTIQKYGGRITKGPGGVVALRGSVKNLVGIESLTEEEIDDMSRLTTDSQRRLAEQLVTVLQNGWLDKHDAKLLKSLGELYHLLRKALPKRIVAV